MSHHAFFEVSIPTLPTCTQLILEMTSEATATIVIDGVDALGNSSQDLLDALQYLVEDSLSVLIVFVSSREYAIMARSLHLTRCIRVISADHSKDVAVFMNHRVSKPVEQKRLLGGRVSDGLQEDITAKIINSAGEIFLWASLQLQHLCNGRVFKLREDVVSSGCPHPLRSGEIDGRGGKNEEFFSRCQLRVSNPDPAHCSCLVSVCVALGLASLAVCMPCHQTQSRRNPCLPPLNAPVILRRKRGQHAMQARNCLGPNHDRALDKLSLGVNENENENGDVVYIGRK